MTQKFDTGGVISILNEVAGEFSRHAGDVQRLDALIADGDMGVTVELASKAITDFLANPAEDDIGKLLMKCGLQINKMSPSTFGTLLAAAFMEAGKAALGRKEIEVKDLVLVGRGAIDGIKKRGKSNVGEKTMLDSLVPAVDAFQKGLARGDYRAAVDAAVKAAKTGMEATVNMKAKHSRASYRHDGGVGVQDAGATAMYYLIEAFGRSLLARS